MNRLLRAFVALCVAAQLAGCGFVVVHGIKYAWGEQKKRQVEVDLALEHYRVLVLQREPDPIADTFAVDGELSRDDQPALVGRGAIRGYLDSFDRYQVVGYELHTDTSSPRGRAFELKGTYKQTLLWPGGATTDVAGTFDASWSRDAGDHWLISRLHTAEGGTAAGS
jgi:hypothetical protein